jgi:murein DD-endopeptidase MepM/ murein hydrolase activator NlpD
MIFPVLGDVRWHNTYNADRGSFRHTGVDIGAPKMRPVLAAVSGRLGLKPNSFWIVGEGYAAGYTILGTHLNDDNLGTNDGQGGRDLMFAPNLRSGDRVIAGQLIGYVGDSGNATGPHLHFELHGPTGLLDPTPSLHMAQRLQRARPVLLHPKRRPNRGEIRVDGVPRWFNPKTRILRLQLVARQTSDGRAQAYSFPTRVALKLSQRQIEEFGGAAGIATLPKDRVVHAEVSGQLPGGMLMARVSLDYVPVRTVQREFGSSAR